MSDAVNSPAHYRTDSIECIDAIRAQLGREGFVSYCHGNAVKYLWRWQWKGRGVDLAKAQYYLNRMIEEVGE